MLKKLFIFLFAIFVATDSFATTDIASNAESSTCNDTVLGTTEGDVNFDAKWQANNIQLRWYNQGELLSVQTAAQTCNYDGALTIPSTEPERTGYTFAGWTVVPGLPAGYTELEYAESTGTQYIDLGYKGNGNTKVEVKYRYHTVSSATGSGRVFGSRISSQSDAFAIGTTSGTVGSTNNKIFWCYDSQPYFVDGTTFGLDVWKTVVLSATEHSINGVSAGDDFEIVEFETPTNLKLFGFDNNGAIGLGYVDIAYCKLWDNGVLIRDLVPAKNSSNVVGMYDRVSGQFFTNAGTGDFIAGSDAQ